MILTGERLARVAASLPSNGDADPLETAEWLESLEAVLATQGPDRARQLLATLVERAVKAGVTGLNGSALKGAASRGDAAVPTSVAATPYVNTIPADQQPAFPGDRVLERKIKSAVRWNAMAMVHRANRTTNVGGHIATFASAATLYEIGFNHFFRGRTDTQAGDIIYFQGHASPGMYGRAFLEGRLTERNLQNFRQELQPGGGLSSYPHPWLMPDFWQFPTVSMGLGPIMSIYQARFNRYLRDRGLASTDGVRVWAFLGDGECDEPETLGAIGLAGREKLDNLTWVINCNLQRLDGPVRGNGKIIQELEGIFRGAGWNVIKVVWGSGWDSLLAADKNGILARRMLEVVDGEYQEYVVKDGAFIRQHFFNTPELKALAAHLTDEQLADLKRGGHDPLKVYAAYKAAVEHKGQPTVVLAKTVKGFGMKGIGGEGANITHQQKKIEARLHASDSELSPEESSKKKELEGLRQFRDRFGVPIPDDKLAECPFYTLPPDSPEARYLHERRSALGGYQPFRNTKFTPLPPPAPETFADLHKGTVAGKGQSTTLAWVNLMGRLCRDAGVGKFIVPIVPDEGQTFGMPPLYKAFGMYSSVGQIYTPVDKGSMTEYRESTTGQILQEGINEAGSMSSFVAAGTAYSNHGVNTIPFYIYYSMFGFQRVGDLIWAAADSRCRGFLMGATAGRTTINGEGLQHEDGHSHLAAMTVPTCRAYDPAFAYELAVIIEDGIRKMYVDGEDVFYYLTVYNESYDMPPMPDGVREGILRGLYRTKVFGPAGAKAQVQLLGSGVIYNEAARAADILATKYGVGGAVWSATSYQQLKRDALEAERWNRLHPDQPAKLSYVEKVLADTKGPVVAASDYMRAWPELIGPYVKDGKGSRLLALGTDGFGRSETRKNLRRFFEVDAECIAAAALYSLAERGEFPRDVAAKAIKDLGIDAEKPAPWTV